MGVAHVDDGERYGRQGRQGRHCALAGCGRAITTTTGRPERRYCTAAHRAAARRGRRAALRAGPPAPPASAEGASAWARRVAVALAALTGQLDALGPADERRPALLQRRAALASQLDAYLSLRRVRRELAISEQHLRAVEAALAGTDVADRPRPGPRPAAGDG